MLALRGGVRQPCLCAPSVFHRCATGRWTTNPHPSSVAFLLSLYTPSMRDHAGSQISLEYLHFVGESGLVSFFFFFFFPSNVSIKGISLLYDVSASGSFSRCSLGWSLLSPAPPRQLSLRDGVLGR